MTTYRSPLSRQGRNLHPPECPHEHLAVAPAGDIWEYTDLVIHDTRGRRVSPSLLRARQRLLRCRQMTNSPLRVQASGGLRFSGGLPPAFAGRLPGASPAHLRLGGVSDASPYPWCRTAADGIEASDVIPMFPTCVCKFQIEAGLRDALRLQRDVLVLHRAPRQTALVSEATDLAPADDPSRGDS